MADELHKNKRATIGNMGGQQENDGEDEGLGVSPPDEHPSEDALIWKNKYMQLLADLENTKKRLNRSSVQEVEVKKEALLRDVLPVADGLDMALKHIPREEDDRSILQGIEMVRSILNKFLGTYEVNVIDAWGEPFDPRLHEAIGMMPHSKYPPNTVVRVELKGYLYRDKLLRPAQVVVTPS